MTVPSKKHDLRVFGNNNLAELFLMQKQLIYFYHLITYIKCIFTETKTLFAKPNFCLLTRFWHAWQSLYLTIPVEPSSSFSLPPSLVGQMTLMMLLQYFQMDSTKEYNLQLQV